MRRLPDWRELLIMLLLAAGLSATVHHLAADLATRDGANDVTFRRAPASVETHLRLRQEWRPRIGSALAARLANEVHGGCQDRRDSHLERVVGSHAAAWLFLANALLIVAFGRRAPSLMWGVFAAVGFGYAPGLVTRVYPWDLPALFFFTAFVALLHHGRWRWLPAVVLVGLLFKETTAVLCLAPLAREVPWRRRLREVGLLAAAFVALKIGVDLLVGNPLPLLSPTVRPPDGGTLRLVENLAAFGTLSPAHPLWINAGTLIALFLVPGRDRELLVLKTMAAGFTASLLLFGSITEYRIWFEAAPLAVYAIARWVVWREPAIS